MREFGHKRPVRNPVSGEIIDMKPSPVGAITRGGLDGSFGPDRDKRLITTLEDGDLIVIRPSGTRRPEKMTATDVYRYMIRCKANRIALEKARDKKSRKAQRLADLRAARHSKKLTRQAFDQQ